MKTLLFPCIVFSLALVTGCSDGVAKVEATDEVKKVEIFNEEQPGIEGFIMKKEAGRILVVSSNPQDPNSAGGNKEFYDAIWFSNVPEEVETGQKVKVWFGIVAESYPGHSRADKISILPSKNPDGADLSDTEAINKFLTLQASDIKELSVPVLKAVNYDKHSDSWTILLKESSDVKMNWNLK